MRIHASTSLVGEDLPKKKIVVTIKLKEIKWKNKFLSEALLSVQSRTYYFSYYMRKYIFKKDS
jgi:hypothetical protein